MCHAVTDTGVDIGVDIITQIQTQTHGHKVVNTTWVERQRQACQSSVTERERDRTSECESERAGERERKPFTFDNVTL